MPTDCRSNEYQTFWLWGVLITAPLTSSYPPDSAHIPAAYWGWESKTYQLGLGSSENKIDHFSPFLLTHNKSALKKIEVSFSHMK